ncbi:MAG: hypothetical protein ACO242_05930 [Candidatus Fonsibacter ubiquis]
MIDFRDLAVELAEDDPMHMLICCLKYMSQDDVEDMLKCNDFLNPPELESHWDDDQELEAYSLECAFGPEE